MRKLLLLLLLLLTVEGSIMALLARTDDTAIIPASLVVLAAINVVAAETGINTGLIAKRDVLLRRMILVCKLQVLLVISQSLCFGGVQILNCFFRQGRCPIEAISSNVLHLHFDLRLMHLARSLSHFLLSINGHE